MFSSSSRILGRVAPVLGMIFLGLTALSFTSGTAAAFEGIQGQYAIFYPSVELLYYHTDNLFLTPANGKSADTFIVKPKFRLEVPTDRHFFTVEYSPQYRDVSNINLDEDVSHFFDIGGRFQGSPIFRVDADAHVARGVLETEEVDPDNELAIGFDPFLALNGSVGFTWEGQRQGATVNLAFSSTEFDRDVPTVANPAPSYFEEDQMGGGVTYFYKFTPLTQFNMGYQFTSYDQQFAEFGQLETDPINGNCIGGPCLGQRDVDSDSNEVFVGFEGELGRTTTGSVRLGFMSREFDQVDVSDFESLTLDASFTKAFTRFTKLEVNLHRDQNSSNFENNGFYTANRIGAALTNQPLGRRVFWTLAAGFQRNDYPDPVSSAGQTLSREDDIIMARAEVGFYPLTHLNLKLNYRFEDRDSNMPNSAFDYEENAIIFQVGLGF